MCKFCPCFDALQHATFEASTSVQTVAGVVPYIPCIPALHSSHTTWHIP